MKKILMILIVLTFSTFVVVSLSLADGGERYRSDSSPIFESGWMNAANYQANQAARQAQKSSQKKSLLQDITEYVQSRIAAKVETAKTVEASTKPVLQKKMSGSSRKAFASIQANFNPAKYNVKIGDVGIGSGSDQVYVNGILMSEKNLDGTHNIYVGFGYAGTKDINSAIQSAKAGDKIFVNAGVYHENINVNGVSVYGIIGDGGATTTLYGSVNISNISGSEYVEFAGFTIIGSGENSSGGTSINISGSTGTVKLWGNDIKNSYTGILVSGNVLAENNVIHSNVKGIELTGGSATFSNNLIQDNQTGFIYSSSIFTGHTVLDKNVFLSNLVDLSSPLTSGTPSATQISPPTPSQTPTPSGSPMIQPLAGQRGPTSTPQDTLFLTALADNSSSTGVLSLRGNLFSSGGGINSFLNSYYMTWSGNYLPGSSFALMRNMTTGLYDLSSIPQNYGIGTNVQSADYSKLTFVDNTQARSAYSLSLTSPRATTELLSTVAVYNLESTYRDKIFETNDYTSKFVTDTLGAMIMAKNPESNSSSLQPAAGNMPLTSIDDAVARAIMIASATSLSSKNLEGENPKNIEAIAALANIIEHPTEEQKILLDAVKMLLADAAKVQDKGYSPELKKAEDDLLNAVANILLGQAIPDLIKNGGMASIKTIFSGLDTRNKMILLEYDRSTKPYYDNLLKDMARNMSVLQSRNILGKNMTEEELKKLSPLELDKILNKIRKQEKKISEEEYLLQQEAKYRKQYIDPNKEKLQADMKNMLKDFTGRINDVIKAGENK